MNQRLYGILLLFSVLCGIGGLLTLMPSAGASWPNVLGYSSLCTFAPAASLYCFAIAGFTCVMRASLVKRAAYNSGKPVFRIAPILVVVVVLGLAIASNIWVGRVNASYTDGTTSATEESQ